MSANVVAIEQVKELRTMAETYWRADQARHGAMADLRLMIQTAAVTMSEAEMARVTGLTRMTVRKALGK
jgi:hypothetical protein